MKVALAALLAAAALSGCGGDDTASTAAGVVPANAAAFIEVDSDLGSAEWQQLDDLLRKFPGRADLLREIREGLAEEELSWERDVEPALGETTALVWLDFENDGENVVGITKPDDKEKFRQLLTKLNEDSDEKAISRDVGEWTLIAETDALLDRVADDDPNLAGDDRYTEALDDLPDDRLATAYVDMTKATDQIESALQGEGLDTFGLGNLEQLESVAAAVTAEEKGVNATIVARSTGDVNALGVGEAYESRFLDEVPGDALLFASFSGEAYRTQLEELPEAQREQLREFERMAGVSLEQLMSLLEGEGAFYVRPGALIPEVTLLLEADDEAEAVATVDRLARRAAGAFGGAPRTQKIEGVDVKTLSLGPVGLNYGAFDGKLVVSLSTTAFEQLQSDDEKLADAEDFEQAAEAAGLPDETSGLFYLNVQDLLPTLETILGFAGAESEDVPPEVVDNIRPLRSIVSYATADGNTARSVVFVHIE